MRESDVVPYDEYAASDAGSRDRAGDRYANAYETTASDGATLYVMSRQFRPPGSASDWYVAQTFHPGSSHWDVYEIHDGWVSTSATRDNTGLNQTFFGRGKSATPYNGWLDFPVRYFSSLGEPARLHTASVPVRGVYWEQAGLAWPLTHQTISSGEPKTLTTWKLLPHYRFDSGKTMNTVVAYHQSPPLPNAANPDAGHLEAWFFTVPYGPSRWEVWSAATCLVSSCRSYIQSSCRDGTATATFPYAGKNVTYYRTNCVDWERQTAPAPSGSVLAALPVPQANLLRDFHFAAAADAPARVPAWLAGNGLRLFRLQSKAPGDTQIGRYDGLRYIKIACSRACSADSSLSQDVFVRASGVYSFGLEAKTESSPGVIAVALSQVDASGKTLGLRRTISRALDAGGDGSNCRELPGVENCTLYVGGRVRVTLQPGATRLRVTVYPLTSDTDFDLTDVFLSRLEPPLLQAVTVPKHVKLARRDAPNRRK